MILAPRSLSELSDICQQAQQQNSSLLPIGNGSKLHWLPASTAEGATLVTTRQLPERFEHASADLVLTVSAGFSFALIQSRLKSLGQFVAIVPPYENEATIGGVIATGINGSLRHRYGGVRDMVLGIEFMDSAGVLAKAGGKVVKNVAGYDLMKLLTGSWGTLAIITAITLRLYPHPPTQAALTTVGTGQEIGTILQQLAKSGLTPTIVDIETTGKDDRFALIVEFSGLAPAVAGQVEQFRQLTQPIPHQAPAPDPENALCKIGILPAHALDLAQKFAHHSLRIHIGSGIGTAQLPPDLIPALQAYCQAHGGYCQILYPPLVNSEGNPHPLTAAIKRQLDPTRTFPTLTALAKD